MLIQIYTKSLLSWENYVDAASVVVNFINNNGGLKASLRMDAFLLIFRDISNISKIAKD